VAQDDLILQKDQLRALEKTCEGKQAHGEIETKHPGYLGSQDTNSVENITGVERIYQQTLSILIARLLWSNSTIATAAIEEQNIPLLRILTDRGSEHSGNRELHDYDSLS